MLKLEVLGLPITKFIYVNFPVQLKFQGLMVLSIVLTPFYTDDEASKHEIAFTMGCSI